MALWTTNHVTVRKRAALLADLALTEGHIDDLEIAYLKTAGATSDQINDAWVEVFAITLGLAATGNFNTDAYAWLGGLGHTSDSLSGRWFTFWDIGVLP